MKVVHPNSQTSSDKMTSKRATLCAPLLVSVLLVGHLLTVEAQFFTKSSKSIPRMGRRSTLEPDSHRRALVDSLLDQLGPEVVAALKFRVNEEVAEGNEQPLDPQRPPDYLEPSEPVARSERSASRAPNYKESSLALRALNTNRFLQHLASGRPLTSYDTLFSPPANNLIQEAERAPKIYGDK